MNLPYHVIVNRINKVLCTASAKQMPMACLYCFRLIRKYEYTKSCSLINAARTDRLREELYQIVRKYKAVYCSVQLT